MNPDRPNTVLLAAEGEKELNAPGMYFFWVNLRWKMITKPGRGENILEQQTFANQTKKGESLTYRIYFGAKNSN